MMMCPTLILGLYQTRDFETRSREMQLPSRTQLWQMDDSTWPQGLPFEGSISSIRLRFLALCRTRISPICSELQKRQPNALPQGEICTFRATPMSKPPAPRKYGCLTSSRLLLQALDRKNASLPKARSSRRRSAKRIRSH